MHQNPNKVSVAGVESADVQQSKSVAPTSRLQGERALFYGKDVGTRDGRHWAQNRASFTTLKLLDSWWKKYRYPENGRKYFLPDLMVMGMHPGVGLMHVAEERNEIFNCYGDNEIEGVTNEYCVLFIEAAVEVYREISASSEGSV